MRYLPILEELCSSDSVLFMVVGIIVALVISVKFCDTKRNLIGLIGSFVVYAICEVLTNFYTNYMLEIALLFVGTLALGAFIGFPIGLIVTIVSGKIDGKVWWIAMNKQEVYQYLEQNNIEYEAVEHNIVDDVCDVTMKSIVYITRD